MWIGFAIGLVVGTPQLVRSFRARREPEPTNSRLKLPVTVFMLGVCLTLAITGTAAAFFSVLGSVFLVQIGFIVAGRNPWWMQAWTDKRENVRYSSLPPRDLEID
jgi:putative Mn2+ efflux pump MntP